jgi:flagellar FliL protein
MADEDDLDLGVEPQTNSQKKLIVIAAAAALVLLGLGVGTWLLFSGDESVSPEQADGQEQPEIPTEPATYHDMGPVFVVNLPGKPRMLQVGLQVRLRSPDLGEFLEYNDPALRHGILNLLGAQDGQTLKSRAGKERLQQELEAEINRLIAQYQGPGEVETVLFSSFVMQ